jgi:hypothetical protein
VAEGKAVASLLVSIGADISGLQQGGQQAAKSMQDLGKHAKELGSKMAALGAAAAAAGAAMVVGLTKAGLESIDVQAKLARSLGSTIDGLRALQLATGEAGISSDQLKVAMEQLNSRLGEAQRGTGQAKKALDMLGLSARDLSQMDTDARIATIADRIRELGLSTSQTADVLRNFGIRGGEMVDFLRQGGDAIRAAREDVEAFGLSLSAVDAAKVEAANDAIGRIGLVLEGVKNQLAIAFAPMLQELANRFNNLAKENKGFGDQATQTAETIAKGFGYVGDVLHGLHVVIKGLQLVAEGFGGAFYSVVQGIMEAVVALNDAVARDINKTIGWFNSLGASISELPLMTNSEWVNDFRRFADGSRDRVARVRGELHELAMQEMPSDKIAAFFEDVKARAQEAAEAVVASQSGGGSFESEDEGASKYAEQQAKLLEAQREALAARLNAIIEFAAAEDDLEIARHEEKLEALRAGLEEELIIEEEYQILKQALEEKHLAKIAELRKKGMSDLEKFTNASYSKQAGMIAGYLADITAGVARENKAMFELNKAAGIANAIVSAYEGISHTLGAYPYPINIPLAAAHAAAAFAQVSAIKSQSFSSGGGAAPSLAGGTPATPVTPVNGGTPQSAGGGSLLTVEGISPDALFSGRTVRALAERLAEHQRDGGTVVFA